MEGLPDLLTIEEAARVIRVGRTKAYAMARQWRATDGETGLPVIDFGHALRVPLCQLEKLIGGPLTARESQQATSAAGGTATAEPPVADPEPQPGPAVGAVVVPDTNDSLTRSPRRPSRRRPVAPDQPTLPFES